MAKQAQQNSIYLDNKNHKKNYYRTENKHQAISRFVGCLIRLKNVRNDVQGLQNVNTNRDQEGD